jgi:hypothetical protein
MSFGPESLILCRGGSCLQLQTFLMTVAVAHREADRVVVDLVRERRPPFSPTDVCLEFSAALKSYGINSVQSDKYAGAWPVEAFAPHGVRVEQSARAKSDLYIDLLPLLNSRRIALLDVPRLVNSSSGWNAGRRAAVGTASTTRPAGTTTLPTPLRVPLRSRSVNKVWWSRGNCCKGSPPWRKYTARGFRRRAALTNMIIPREQQCYPRSVLPADKSEKEGESR